MKTPCTILFIACSFIKVYAQSVPSPIIFLPDKVSTGNNERDLAISPDGSDMFYTLQAPRNGVSVILYRNWNGATWSEAEVASFSGQYSDLEPAFSFDGNRLFFVSNRPFNNTGAIKDFDIWYVDKSGKGWAQPVHAGMQINSPKDEYYPSMTRDGSVYFTAERPDALGKEDIYKSQWKMDHFETPVNIGTGVNSVLDEFNAFVDPNEQYIIYGKEGGEGDIGRGDLYISYRNLDGTWSPAKNLGLGINSQRLDYCPFVYKGVFYFTSERPVPKLDARKRSSLTEILKSLNSFGNGWGDIYSVPLHQVIHKP